MNAKRLIEVLESIVEEHGDVELYIPATRGDGSFEPLADLRLLPRGLSTIAYLSGKGRDDYWKECGAHRAYRNEPVVNVISIVEEQEYEQL